MIRSSDIFGFALPLRRKPTQPVSALEGKTRFHSFRSRCISFDGLPRRALLTSILRCRRAHLDRDDKFFRHRRTYNDGLCKHVYGANQGRLHEVAGH
jgi:hypothetical protein